MKPDPGASIFGKHYALVEQGITLARSNEHERALELYRQALAKAQLSGAEPVVMRYYLECILESLEHIGAYAEILAYCDNALAHYDEYPPQTIWQWKDLASIHERAMLMHVKLGNPEEAKWNGDNAVGYARKNGFALPLTNKVMRWLMSSLHISRERIEQEQKKHGYFVVETANTPRMKTSENRMDQNGGDYAI